MKNDDQERALGHFWDFKLVPINSTLNSVSGNLSQVFKNVEMVPRKPAKFENPAKHFSEMSFESKLEKI